MNKPGLTRIGREMAKASWRQKKKKKKQIRKWRRLERPSTPRRRFSSSCASSVTYPNLWYLNLRNPTADASPLFSGVLMKDDKWQSCDERRQPDARQTHAFPKRRSQYWSKAIGQLKTRPRRKEEAILGILYVPSPCKMAAFSTLL